MAGGHHRCCCSSKYCNEIRKIFTEAKDPRGGRPVEMKYSESHVFTPYFQCLCRNLHIPPDKKASICKVGAHFHVARHHWKPELVAKGGRWTSLLTKHEAKKYLHKRERIDQVKKNGVIFYRKVPNEPIEKMKKIADAMKIGEVEERCRRAKNRAEIKEDKDKVILELKQINECLKEEVSSKAKKISQQARVIRCLKAKLANVKKEESNISTDYEGSDNMFTLQEVMEMIREHGGISRLTITDDGWHKLNPGAALTLFGFKTWDETKIYVKCLFPDVDVIQSSQRITIRPTRGSNQDRTSRLLLPHLSNFERCLIAKLFFHRKLTSEFLGLVFGKHRTWIGRVLQEWAPRWGKAGEWLSILDVSVTFFRAEEPDKAVTLGLRDCILTDGINIRTEVKRSDLSVKREQYSSKQGTECARALNFSGAGGTSFEHTKLFGAHISEHGVLEWKGSAKVKEVNITSWKDIAKVVTKADIASLKLETAIDNLLDRDDIEEMVNTADTLLGGDSAPFDDIFSTGLSHALDHLRANKGLDSYGACHSNKRQKGGTFRVERVDSWFEERLALDTAQVLNNKRKQSPFLSIEKLKEQNRRALEGGVNSSGLEKLAQLEVLERLHENFQSKLLSHNLLSFFLLVTESDRHKLLKWMGSNAGPENICQPQVEDLPKLMNGLAKIPVDFIVLGDKGFHGTSRYYPNLNVCETPLLLRDCKNYRKNSTAISEDRKKATVRSTIEGDFARYKISDVLKETVPYYVVHILPYAHEWGFAEMNLKKPYRKPHAANGYVTDEYWQD